MKVLLIQTGEPIHSEIKKFKGMRLINFSNYLNSENVNVQIITSLFNHQTKQFREFKQKDLAILSKFKYIFLNSLGYKKNVGFKRIIDHISLSFSFIKTLFTNKINLPDVVFVGYPPIELTLVVVIWCKLRNIPVVVDFKDRWPQMFWEDSKILKSIIYKIAFSPYYLSFLLISYLADARSSMTKSFLDSMTINFLKSKNNFDFIFPLISYKDHNSSKKIKPSENIFNLINNLPKDITIIFFVGNFMANSYDFASLVQACNILSSKNIKVPLFVFAGDGPSKEYLIEKIKNKSFEKNFIFPGFINQAEIELIASKSNYGFAPIVNRNDYILSLPNKVLDYFANGLKIITSLKGETKNFVENNKLGFFYKDSEDLAKIFINIENDFYSKKSIKNVYLEHFNQKKIFNNALNCLENLSLKKNQKKWLH